MWYAPYIINELYDIFQKTPNYLLYLEASLLAVGIWVILHKAVAKNGKKLSQQQIDSIVFSWKPQPLVDETPADHRGLRIRKVSGHVGKHITVDGQKCLNLATHNYLGLLEDETIREKAITSLKKYGVGSCGPRGFYGTVDVHLELEERLANFMQMEEAVVYSYGFSTIASAIPAYCKRGDIVFVDECVNFAIQKGLDASRSKIVFYKHNDMADLEEHLMAQKKTDNKNPKKAAKIRRFLIAEAIYMNTGEMCPLVEAVELRKKYKLRLFLDESISFGTLGKHGRGLTEYLNVDRKEIDLICGSLEWAVGSIGGFCVGTTFVVDHQRLSGLGYCFSASAPPLLTQAAISALDRFESEPQIFETLNKCATKVHHRLCELTHLTINGHVLSPVKHLHLKTENDRDIENDFIDRIIEKCYEKQLSLINPEYLDNIEVHCPRPSIRLSVNCLLSDADIEFVFETLESVTKAILQ